MLVVEVNERYMLQTVIDSVQLRAMSSPMRGVSPSRFLLLQETASRVNSVASTAPGSTRLGQGLAAPKKWMKLDAQGVVSYIKAKLLC